MSKILEEDFEYIIRSLGDFSLLKHSTVLVTGATGLVGSFIVKMLNYMNKYHGLNITIVALIRNQDKAREILSDCDVTYILGDICNMPKIDSVIDYIIHCAAITKSIEMISIPVEVTEGIIIGTKNLLQVAYEKRVKSMVYLSSLEVYGQTNQALEFAKEEDLGYIEIQNVRNCYPLSKRMAENLCYAYHSEYKVPVKIARLAQVFGAGILKEESRVFGQFAKSAINKEDLILHTDGLSTGNYCYTADAVLAIVLLLLNGENGEIYNVSNEVNCMTIGQMADLVASIIAKGQINVKYEIQDGNKFGYAVPMHLKLSSEKIRTLGWKPKYNMIDMYCRMIAYMEESCIE